jgi:hypothetical protein
MTQVAAEWRSSKMQSVFLRSCDASLINASARSVAAARCDGEQHVNRSTNKLSLLMAVIAAPILLAGCTLHDRNVLALTLCERTAERGSDRLTPTS